jgi:hypothetical protein
LQFAECRLQLIVQLPVVLSGLPEDGKDRKIIKLEAAAPERHSKSTRSALFRRLFEAG